MAKSQKPKSTRKPPVATPEAPPASAATLTPATPDPAPEPSEAKGLVRKRSFVDRVMVEAGVKRGEAKAMSESVLKVLGEAPAQAMGLVYQTMAHSISLSMQNAMQTQGGLQQIGNAVTSSACKMILDSSGGGMGGGGKGGGGPTG